MFLLNEFILSISTYYFINMGEYILHNFSHNHKYGGIMYKWHKHHHVVEFPIHALTRDEYPNITPRYKNIFIYFIILGWIMMYHILQFYHFKIVFIESFIYFVIIDKLHDSYHLNNSVFEKYEWFKKKKKKHLLHHKKQNRNYNLLDYSSDKLLKTYN